MTDKEIIRTEIVRRMRAVPKEEEDKRLRAVYGGIAHELTEILDFIDSLQEEPAPKILEDMLNEKTPAESLGISQEEHDRIVDELIYGKEPELVDVDDLPKEEPVSDDMEEAANEIVNKAIPPLAVKYKDGTYVGKIMDCFDRKEFIDLVKAGAKWQKQKDNNNANHALVEQIKTQQMCYEKGIADMRQQMMAKAIDGDITFDYYGDDDKTYGCIAHDSFCLEDFGLKDRDKVKVIIIKE